MKNRCTTSIAALACAAVLACAAQTATPPAGTDSAPELVLPARQSPAVVAVLAHPQGAETTDFLVPLALLRRAQVAPVVAVSPQAGRTPLMPALEVEVDTNLQQFDQAHPQGAQVVVVPALHRADDPVVLEWLRQQRAKGALIVGICAGAQVLAHAGLLDGRRYSGHWWDRDTLARLAPTGQYVPNQRYVVDDGIMTTTGVSASLPASLALVQALAGRPTAQALAAEVGLADWGSAHHSAGYQLGWRNAWTTVRNSLAWWRHESLGIAVQDGSDDVSLALLADAWSRTYRSQAVAIAPGPVTLASGLRLWPGPAPVPHTPPLALAPTPARCQLEQALDGIAQRYGKDTSAWVAVQLEYERPQSAPGCAAARSLTPEPDKG